MNTNVFSRLISKSNCRCFTECEWFNRERSRLAAASSVCDSTKHNGLVTPDMSGIHIPTVNVKLFAYKVFKRIIFLGSTAGTTC